MAKFRDISDILLVEGTVFELYNSKGYNQTLASLRLAEVQINNRILAIAGDTWTKRKLNEIKRLIESEINNAYGGIFASMQNESIAAAGITAGAIAGDISIKIPTRVINDLTSNTREIQVGLKDQKIPSMVGFKELFDLKEDEHVRAMKRVISAGVSQGLAANSIVRNMNITNRKQASQLRQRVFTVIADSRTQGNVHAFKELERLGVVSYYEHLSVLDSDTSEICRPRDMRRYFQKWDDIKSFNKPPLHMNCRSRLSPKTGRDLSDIRPSQGGEIPNIRYAEWFKQQPSWLQLKVLGKNKFELFKRGQFEIVGLPDVVGKRLDLDTIESSLNRYSRGD